MLGHAIRTPDVRSETLSAADTLVLCTDGVSERYDLNEIQGHRTIPVDALAGSVQGIEAYYNIAIAESVALTLDFQWADSAVRGIDDSIIPGLRLNLTF